MTFLIFIYVTFLIGSTAIPHHLLHCQTVHTGAVTIVKGLINKGTFPRKFESLFLMTVDPFLFFHVVGTSSLKTL